MPFDVTLHDYYALCPQVNLLPWPDLTYCSEPGPAGCNACIADRPSFAAADILSWRRRHGWLFLEADRVICPSEDARARLERHGLAGRAIVVPHEPVAACPWVVTPPPLKGRKLRIAVLGVLAAQKGAHSVIGLAEAADPAAIELHLIGHPEEPLPETAGNRIIVSGQYAEGDLPRLLAQVKPHVVWLPAPWPETYSYTLSAAIAAGLPVVAARIGSFSERLDGRPLSWLVDPKASTQDWLRSFDLVRQALVADAMQVAPSRAKAEPSLPKAAAHNAKAVPFSAKTVRLGAKTAPQHAKATPPMRLAVADFYAERYLAPEAPPFGQTPGGHPADAARNGPTETARGRPTDAGRDDRTGSARGDPTDSARDGPSDTWKGGPRTAATHGLVDLCRPGRISVVVVPELLDNDQFSPCAYIRLLQPLDHPAIGAGFDIVLADAREALRYRADIIATQRYAVPDIGAADALIAHCRGIGATLAYDLDDDLLHIPRDHSDALALRPKARMVQRLLRGAGAVFVSTPALAASLAPERREAVVVPNALDERLWADRPAGVLPGRRGRGGPLRLLCMGTATHAADFALIEPALARLKDTFGDRVMVDMLGFSPQADLPDWVNRLAMPPSATAAYPGFVNWITQQSGWDIGLAPLADTAFNRCKSAIKTLDYAALGLAVVASDVATYHGSLADGPGGMLAANHPDAWHATLLRLVRDGELRRSLARGAMEAFAARGTLGGHAEARRAAWMALAVSPKSSGPRLSEPRSADREQPAARSAKSSSTGRPSGQQGRGWRA